MPTGQAGDLNGLGLVKDIMITLGVATVDEPAVERVRNGTAEYGARRNCCGCARRRCCTRTRPTPPKPCCSRPWAWHEGAWPGRCALRSRWRDCGKNKVAAGRSRTAGGGVYAHFAEGFASQDPRPRTQPAFDELQDQRPGLAAPGNRRHLLSRHLHQVAQLHQRIAAHAVEASDARTRTGLDRQQRWR